MSAVVGGAAVGVAGHIANRRSRPKLLAKGLDPRNLAGQIDLKDAIRHIGNFAEQVEARSEDVRSLSAQAKQLSRRIT